MDDSNRADFLSGLKPNGKYAGIVGVYRHNTSADRIGVFDKEIIGALAPNVKWIAHNGAGYDQIDILECKAKGSCAQPHHILTRILIPPLSVSRNQGLQHPRSCRRCDSHNSSLPCNLYSSPILPRRAVPPPKCLENVHLLRKYSRSHRSDSRYPRTRWDRLTSCPPCSCIPHENRLPLEAQKRECSRLVRILRQAGRHAQSG